MFVRSSETRLFWKFQTLTETGLSGPLAASRFFEQKFSRARTKRTVFFKHYTNKIGKIIFEYPYI